MASAAIKLHAGLRDFCAFGYAQFSQKKRFTLRAILGGGVMSLFKRRLQLTD